MAAALGPECLVIQVSHVLNTCINPNLTMFLFLLAPKRPTNVEITRINSSSIQVTWSPPDMGNCTDVDGYRITCYDDLLCYRSYYFMEETSSHSLSVTLHDPYDNEYFNSCFFYCRVSGNNSAGVGPAVYVEGRE